MLLLSWEHRTCSRCTPVVTTFIKTYSDGVTGVLAQDYRKFQHYSQLSQLKNLKFPAGKKLDLINNIVKTPKPKLPTLSMKQIITEEYDLYEVV